MEMITASGGKTTNVMIPMIFLLIDLEFIKLASKFQASKVGLEVFELTSRWSASNINRIITTYGYDTFFKSF